MKTVKYVAEKGCKVKIAGKEYSGNMVIPVGKNGLSEAEAENLLKKRFIRKIEFSETDGNDSKGEGKKSDNPEEKAREELLKEAKELGFDFTPAATDDEIKQAIAKAKANKESLDKMNKDELKAKAKELGVDIGMLDSEDKIRQKIFEAQK
jgi:hypothetical protein